MAVRHKGKVVVVGCTAGYVRAQLQEIIRGGDLSCFIPGRCQS